MRKQAKGVAEAKQIYNKKRKRFLGKEKIDTNTKRERERERERERDLDLDVGVILTQLSRGEKVAKLQH